MRRALALATVAALIVAGILVASADRSSEKADAAGNTCVKHTKRIVRHVKRHGKRKRIVRIRHYWTCEEMAPTMPMGGSMSPAPTTPTETPAPEPEMEPKANALGVIARDDGGMSYTLSRQTVEAGTLTVQLINDGADPHALEMQRGSKEDPEGPVLVKLSAKSGEQKTASPEVQPGIYRLWCPIAEHAIEGMEATLEVVEAS